MLIEIKCDEFRTYGKVRPPVIFHAGLNTVLGDNSGSNSIGKSTFLLIVDFAFGGEDYAKSDAVRQLGSHNILFYFEFKGEKFCFSRNTIDTSNVSVCNTNYEEIESIPLSKFKERLFELYNIQQKISFRDMVGRYIRVYGRDNLSEKRPLQAAVRETDEQAITALLKLFGVFGRFEEYKAIEKENKAKRDAFKDARKYEFLPYNITTKKQFSENEKKIIDMQTELEQLTMQTDRNVSAEDLQQADVASEIKGKLAYARRQRSRFKSQLQTTQVNMMQGVIPTEGDLADLSRFFPEVDVKTISEIENFHVRMQHILGDELQEEKDRLVALIGSIDDEIAQLEDAQRKLGVPTKLSKPFLDKYSELSGRVRALEKQNEAYTTFQGLRDAVKIAAERLVEVQNKELRFLKNDINAEMVRFNDFIYSGTHKPPVFDLESVKKYIFETPDDTGTGTSYKSLVVFDLSVLKLTELPALVHDSVILKNIGDQPIEKIMELYLQCEKQVFISLDKDDSYTKRTGEILRETTVLQLSENGNELFGRSWNIKE